MASSHLGIDVISEIIDTDLQKGVESSDVSENNALWEGVDITI